MICFLEFYVSLWPLGKTDFYLVKSKKTKNQERLGLENFRLQIQKCLPAFLLHLSSNLGSKQKYFEICT